MKKVLYNAYHSMINVLRDLYYIMFMKNGIVMIGDSITANGHWSKILKHKAINKGVGGDTSDGVLKRLKQIYKYKPKKCFIMIGTNDLSQSITPENIFTSYKNIVEILIDQGIEPFVQSTLYVNGKTQDGISRLGRNKHIGQLNNLLKEYCIAKNINYIDLNKYLSDNNVLKEIYTMDGLHLNNEAYAIWANEISKHI